MTFHGAGGRKTSNAQNLLPNETLKSLEKAKHIVDLAMSPKSTTNHQKALQQFMHHIQKHGAKLPSQKSQTKVGPTSYAHVKGQASGKPKKQASAGSTSHNVAQESVQSVYGVHMHPGQLFTSHFLHIQKQPTSSKSSVMPSSGNRAHKVSDHKLLRENVNPAMAEAATKRSEANMAKTHSQASMRQLTTRQALRQVTGGVLYDQSKSLQKNLAVMKDVAMKEPLVLSVFESAGKHSEETEAHEEQENYERTTLSDRSRR